ncbi:hypothetical protein AAC387_Pa08g1983 [Persea americana]
MEVQVLKKFWLVKSSVMEIKRRDDGVFWRSDGFLDARSARKWKEDRGRKDAPARAEDEWQGLRCNVASLWGPRVVLLLSTLDSGVWTLSWGWVFLARASRP